MTGKQLKEMLVGKGIVFSDLARYLELTPQALNSRFSAENVRTQFIADINLYLAKLGHSSGVSEPEVAYGNVSPYLKGNGRKNLIVVPLKAFGGFLAGYKDKVYIDSLEHHSFPWIQGECFAFEVEGFSMYKTKVLDGEIFEVGYKPGSFVVATPVGEFESMMKGKDYVFQTVDGIILKRFVRLKGDYCEVESINEEYNPVKPLHLKGIKRMYYVEQNIKKP